VRDVQVAGTLTLAEWILIWQQDLLRQRLAR
jgi:hypothetical protein